MKDYEQPLQTLTNMAEESPRRFGLLCLDEEQFYVNTTQLKKALSTFFQPSGISALYKLSQSWQPQIIKSIDELEAVAMNGKAHIFGKVLVSPEDYMQRLQEVKTVLTQAEKQQNEPFSALDIRSREILENAYREAQHIIEAAEAEVRQLQQKDA